MENSTVAISCLCWSVNTKKRFAGAFILLSLYLLSAQPSVQKLVNLLAQDCLIHLNEEGYHSDAYSLGTPRVEDALRDLETDLSTFVDQRVLALAQAKSIVRIQKRDVMYNKT